MIDDAAPPPADEVGVLHSLLGQIRAGQPANPQEVECALETGFAAMIALEAELSRLNRGAGCQPQPGIGSMDEIKVRIGQLREALTDLRTLAVPPGESRVGYGFVLPDDERTAHARSN